MLPAILLFPGQSSRYPQMWAALRAEPACGSVLQEASDALGEDLVARFRDPLEEPLDNRTVQLSVFLANHVRLMTLRDAGAQPVASLGLSLGEYNHLVEIGAIDFADAVRLVSKRGELYDAGPSGIMVSLFPVGREAVEAVLADMTLDGVVEISNDNAPNQVVIAGDADAVNAVAAEVADQEYAEAVTIEHRIPMHSSVFTLVAEQLRPHLSQANWQSPSRPYLPNTTAQWESNPVASTITNRLSDHVHQTVHWRQSIETVLQRYPDAVFVEVGPRRVLCNLLSKRWVKNSRYATDETPVRDILDALTNQKAVAS